MADRKPDWQHGEQVKLYCGDCLEILPELEPVDAVVTDPPYGVMLGEVNNGQAREKNQQKYKTFSDTSEYVVEHCVPVVQWCIANKTRAALTPGTRNAWSYPRPDDIGAWINMAGSGSGKWGFCCFHPILYYGKDPRAGVSSLPNSVTIAGRSSDDIHPCAKPLKLGLWLVHKASVDGECVCDPFLGSGTFGVAAVRLGRRFIGIEIDPGYFEIAVKRIKAELKQGKLL